MLIVHITHLMRRAASWAGVAAKRHAAQSQLADTVVSERAALARLDARLLEDVGVTPAEARRESRRPRWDLPAGRGAVNRDREHCHRAPNPLLFVRLG